MVGVGESIPSILQRRKEVQALLEAVRHRRGWFSRAGHLDPWKGWRTGTMNAMHQMYESVVMGNTCSARARYRFSI